jgi:tRNA (cmo5U34)-methyltransferase
LRNSFYRKPEKDNLETYIESSGLPEEEILAGYERMKLDKKSKLDQQIDWLKK